MEGIDVRCAKYVLLLVSRPPDLRLKSNIIHYRGMEGRKEKETTRKLPTWVKVFRNAYILFKIHQNAIKYLIFNEKSHLASRF